MLPLSISSVGKKVLWKQGRRITARHIRELEKAKSMSLKFRLSIFMVVLWPRTWSTRKTGEVLVECNTELTEEVLAAADEAVIKEDRDPVHQRARLWPFISDTLRQDHQQRAGSAGRNLPHDASR